MKSKFPKCCECGSYFQLESKCLNKEDDDWDWYCIPCLTGATLPRSEAYGYAWQTDNEDFIPF